MSLLIALLAVMSADYTVKPTQGNRFTLQVAKTGALKGKTHLFSFPKYSGTLQYDPKTPAAAKVDFTLDGASMVCEDTWVKQKDVEKILEWGMNKMIEVQKFPEIHFVSQKITETDATHFQATGPLTMRGVTQPATVAVTLEDKSGSLALEGTSTVDMKDWGMKPPSAALGTVGTKPEMQVRFHLVFASSK